MSNANNLKSIETAINNCMSQYAQYYSQSQNEYQRQYRTDGPSYFEAQSLQQQANYALKSIDGYIRELGLIDPNLGKRMSEGVSKSIEAINADIRIKVEAHWNSLDRQRFNRF